jgi:hypothetical protein
LGKEGYAQAKQSWLCGGCARVKPGFREIDVTVQNEKLGNATMNSIMGTDIGVARQEFLFSFGDEIVRRDLYLGRLFREDGIQFQELVTFRGKRRLIIRGRKDVTYRICDRCKRILYYAGFGGGYLYPAPPPGQTIFQSDLCGIVVPEELFRRIDLRKWRMITHEKLAIISPPPDGLGELVEVEESSSQRLP